MEMVTYVPNAEFTKLIEYFLQQPTGEPLLDPFLGELDDDPTPHQKAVILFKLDTEVSRRSISEATLDLLILLGKIEATDTLRRAFREAVVDCALRPLKHGGGGGEVFYTRVKRIWDKVKLPEKTAGLGSEELTSWKRDIQEAAWDDDACGSVLERFESVRAEEAVRVYVNEEKDKIGPSFLTVVADKVKTNHDFERLFREFREGTEKPAVNTTPSSSAKRRRNRRWKSDEEEALMAGVEKFEEGRWKMILNDNPEAFDGRTEGDLKDKWRNLKKHQYGRV